RIFWYMVGMKFVVPRGELIDALSGLFRFYRDGGRVDVAVKDGLVMLAAERRTVTFPVTVLESGGLGMRTSGFRTLRSNARKYRGENVMVTITNLRPDLNTDFAREVQFHLEEPEDATAPSDVYVGIRSHISRRRVGRGTPFTRRV
ncbi:MAG TPA: hypothetical protein VJU82_04140, partial [Acidobacteriaceae bacterium]|nr:hypothetical protein [Acidobacteriaceae bacterium]